MKRILLIILTLIPATVFADTSPIIVDAVSPKQQQWQPSIHVTGLLKASQNTTITSEISGRIVKKNFQDGGSVKKGQLLYELNAEVLKAQLKQAQASLALSKSQLQRNKDLEKQNAVSKSELDVAKATFLSDEAKVEQIKAQIKQTQIKAPFSGKLGFANAFPGNYISAGQALVDLQQLNPIVIELTVPEVFSSKLTQGQKISAWSDAYNQKYDGNINTVDTHINEKNQSILAKAHIPNANQNLIPGSFMSAEIFLTEPKKVITVPQLSIQYENKNAYIYRIIDQKAIKTTVSLGPQIENDIIIVSGLSKTDRVITEGQTKLSDNALVKESL